MSDQLQAFVDTVQLVAKVCHEVNRAYCKSIGDNTQPSWEDAPEWQKKSAADGVIHAMSNPGVTPKMSHENWLKTKKAEGWVYGPVKDLDKKAHPCMVPYNELPKEQQTKDDLFLAVVSAMMGR